MVSADSLKKVAICGAALSCFGAAFFHHRIQGSLKVRNLVSVPNFNGQSLV